MKLEQENELLRAKVEEQAELIKALRAKCRRLEKTNTWTRLAYQHEVLARKPFGLPRATVEDISDEIRTLFKSSRAKQHNTKMIAKALHRDRVRVRQALKLLIDGGIVVVQGTTRDRRYKLAT